MKLICALGAAFTLVAFGSQAARGQCTSETKQGRRLVLEFATQHSVRARLADVPVVDTSQVRPLTSPADSAACQQLFHAWLEQRRDPETAPVDRHWTYYQVGDQYYVVVTRISPPVEQNPDGTINLRLGWIPILVFDRNFQHVVTVGR